MKLQALFFFEDKSENIKVPILKCRLLQFLFGPLRVKTHSFRYHSYFIYTVDCSPRALDKSIVCLTQLHSEFWPF